MELSPSTVALSLTLIRTHVSAWRRFLHSEAQLSPRRPVECEPEERSKAPVQRTVLYSLHRRSELDQRNLVNGPADGR